MTLHLESPLHLVIPPGETRELRIDHGNRGLFPSQTLPEILCLGPARTEWSELHPESFRVRISALQSPAVVQGWRRQGESLSPEPPPPPLWTHRPDPSLKDLPTDRLNLLCPAGIGDFIWIWSKWGPVAQKQPITFWFPDGEQHRAGQYARLVGAEHGYLPGLWTEWVWNRPGDPVVGAEEHWLSVHANTHLECGLPLKDWYPNLPLEVPQPNLSEESLPEEFILAFCCHQGYMEGNLEPAEWAQIFTQLEGEIAPVKLIGAGNDVPFAQEILTHYQTRCAPLFDRPLEEVLVAARSAKAVVGLAGGPMIAAMNLGCPAFVAYPRWLAKMPGSWEPYPNWEWCHTQELPHQLTPERLGRLL